MNEAQPDDQTVTDEGESVARLPVGVEFRPTNSQVDDRGVLWELFDPRWNLPGGPAKGAYCTTVRPGKIKGWNVHRKHSDRYSVLFGELIAVFYDDRPDSPTNGLVGELVLSEYRRGTVFIPVDVWHAVHNVGNKDAVIANFPTELYDYESPDKYRLPLDNNQIPYTFRTSRGW